MAGSEAISLEFEEIATSPAAPRNDTRKFWSENPRIRVCPEHYEILRFSQDERRRLLNLLLALPSSH